MSRVTMGLLYNCLSTMPSKATLVCTSLVATSTRSGAGTLRTGAVATGYQEVGAQWHGEDDLFWWPLSRLVKRSEGMTEDGWVETAATSPTCCDRASGLGRATSLTSLQEQGTMMLLAMKSTKGGMREEASSLHHRRCTAPLRFGLEISMASQSKHQRWNGTARMVVIKITWGSTDASGWRAGRLRPFSVAGTDTFQNISIMPPGSFSTWCFSSYFMQQLERVDIGFREPPQNAGAFPPSSKPMDTQRRIRSGPG